MADLYGRFELKAGNKLTFYSYEEGWYFVSTRGIQGITIRKGWGGEEIGYVTTGSLPWSQTDFHKRLEDWFSNDEYRLLKEN